MSNRGDQINDLAAELRQRRQRRQGGQSQDYKPLSEETQLERQLYLANLALDKYEKMLERGDEMEPEQERLFLAHQDSVRKLEATLSAMKARADLSKKTDKQIAIELVESGISYQQVREMYDGNHIVLDALSDWYRSKEEK